MLVVNLSPDGNLGLVLVGLALLQLLLAILVLLLWCRVTRLHVTGRHEPPPSVHGAPHARAAKSGAGGHDSYSSDSLNDSVNEDHTPRPDT